MRSFKNHFEMQVDDFDICDVFEAAVCIEIIGDDKFGKTYPPRKNIQPGLKDFRSMTNFAVCVRYNRSARKGQHHFSGVAIEYFTP